MREAWTDDRLDDLNSKVDEGFRRVDQRFDRVEDRFEAFEARIDARFDSLQRMLLFLCFGLITGLLGVIASIVATGA